jgi:hypothetical protein
MRRISKAEMLVAKMRAGNGNQGNFDDYDARDRDRDRDRDRRDGGFGAGPSARYDRARAPRRSSRERDDFERARGERRRRVVPEPKNADIRTIYVTGADCHVDDFQEKLRAHYETHGRVVEIRAFANTGRAFVQFETQREARAALDANDSFMGNPRSCTRWGHRNCTDVDADAARDFARGGRARAAVAAADAEPSPPRESEEDRQQREDLERSQAERLEELKAEKESTKRKLLALEKEKAILREKLSGKPPAAPERAAAAAADAPAPAPVAPELTNAEREVLEKAKTTKAAVAKAATLAHAAAAKLRAEYEALVKAKEKKRSGGADGASASEAIAPVGKKSRYSLDLRATQKS